MSEIYFINEEVKKNIEDLKSLMIATLREKVPALWDKWYSAPQILFGEFGETDTRLGYYNGKDNVIVMNQILLDPSIKEERDSVFLHELAHYVVYNRYCNADPHGSIFKKVCAEIGVPENFARAESKIMDWSEKKAKAESKVKKLLALSSSPFEEEADSALSKANEMMKEYSLDYISKEDNRLFGVDGKELGRVDTWRGILYRIIGEMTGCFAVIQKRNRKSHVSFFGSREQVESALYLNLYFEDALEKEYKKNKSRLYGIGEKNAFLYGLCVTLGNKVRKKYTETSLVLSQEKSKSRLKEILNGRFTKRHSYATAGNGYVAGTIAGANMGIPSKQTACKVKRIGYNN